MCLSWILSPQLSPNSLPPPPKVRLPSWCLQGPLLALGLARTSGGGAMAWSLGLLDYVAMLVAGFSRLQPLSANERPPAHQPTALSAFFAEPTLHFSPPWMPFLFPRCLLPNCGGLKGAPLLLPGEWGHQGQGRYQGLPRDSPIKIPMSALFHPWYCPLPPFPSGSAFPPHSCVKAPSSV